MKRKSILGLVLNVFVVLLAVFPVKGQAANEQEVVKVSLPAGSRANEIQKALDQAKTLKETGKKQLEVTLKEGTYELTDDLVIYSDTILVARDCKIIKKHQKGPMVRNYLYDREKGQNYAANIKIIGGLWDGGAGITEKKSDETFRFIHAKNVEVRDLTIKNIMAGHLLTLAGVDHAIVDRCTFSSYCVYGTTKEALHLDLVHSRHMVPVVESSKKQICYDDAPCKNIIVSNCKFYNVPAGVGSHSAVRGMYNENIVIKDNMFTNIEAAAIRCYNYKNVTITGNVIERAGIGMEVYTCTENSENMDDDKTSFHFPNSGVEQEKPPMDQDYSIVIDHNQIHTVYTGKDKKFGNAICVTGSEKRPIANLAITDNIIINAKKNAIHLLHAPKVQVIRNQISGNDQKSYRGGIYLNKSKEARIESNHIRFTERAIEMVMSSQGSVMENQISDSLYDGIYVGNRSRDNRIEGNLIAETAGTGIAIEERADNNQLKNNTIKSANIGIFIKDSRKTKLIGNRFEGTINQKIKDKTT
ncbi:MAG: right-handed parallel beta-helix repeat-containing protein [bacterium]|nr:right-handed parallel beta-helix repeat-containing protein [bacterium]